MIIAAAHGGLAAGYVENLTVVTVEQRQVGRPLRLAPRPAELAGREVLLTALHDRLSAAVGPQPRIAALYGMGGVGKTSMAVEYAHRHKSEFGVVWQFAAEDRAVLEAGFARLNGLLAASGGLSDPRDPVGSVHAVLADSPLPWILIFDNAPDPASVQDYLPGDGLGQVLITSQHGLWPTGLGIEVPELEVEAAAGFLVSRSGDPDLVTARKLAAELGDCRWLLSKPARMSRLPASPWLSTVHCSMTAGRSCWLAAQLLGTPRTSRRQSALRCRSLTKTPTR